MDISSFDLLLSDQGRGLLERLALSDISDDNLLKFIVDLRKDHSRELVEAAVETAMLRRRAGAKFSRAGEMFFSREALEQASGEVVAAYRAERFFGFSRVADLACGVGGDAIGLAGVTQVLAVDRDPLRLAMARENARVCGVGERIEFVEADLTEFDTPEVDAIFFDPARRAGGRRKVSVRDYSPPLSIIERWQGRVPAIGVKISPAVKTEEIPWDCEIEFISLGRELKEAALWFGPLRSARRRATVLPSRATLFGGEENPSIAVVEPLDYLYEPDPAVIRSGLVESLAEMIGASKIDPDIAYLTSDHLVETPFARGYRVLETMPFNVKKLNVRLRELGVGRVIVKKRGSPVEPQELQKKLKLSGAGEMIVVLTHVLGRPSILLCSGE